MLDGSRYVFVGGLHRSGTTPLARLLAEHPEISGLSGTGVAEDEGQHLQDVYPRIRAHGGMGRFANAPAAHLTAESALVSDRNAARLVETWEPYWDLRKRLLLEKSPANMIMGGFLQALFPGSALIVVMRHPLAVALAMQKWNPLIVARNGRRRVSLAGLVAHWLHAHELLRRDAPGLTRLRVLRYEDLVAAPHAELSGIAELLGLSSPLAADAVRPGMGDRYQRQWDAMATGNPIQRHVRRTIETRFGDAIAEYGYDIRRIGEALPLARTPFGVP
ncbi:MAG TPA: sulfotransferase [Jatrophihabitans sp.]|nr:sulfotransferase [Jatrophihabitans sp.]